MNRQFLRTLLIALALPAAGLTQAANMAFMVDQAMSRFSQRDAEYFNEAGVKALEAKDGTEIKWNNPATGAFGTITPYPDPQKNPDCRELHIVSVAENVKSGGYYRFCKLSDGSWQPAIASKR